MEAPSALGTNDDGEVASSTRRRLRDEEAFPRENELSDEELEWLRAFVHMRTAKGHTE